MEQKPITAVERDMNALYGGKKNAIGNMLAKVAKKTGINPVQLGLDFLKLKRRRGKLTFEEFVRYELYDREKWSDDAKSRFLSGFIHWPIFNECITKTWWAVTEDKWLSGTFLEAAGIAVPEIVAIFDTSIRAYPKTFRVSDRDGLKAFLTSYDAFPIFAKNQSSMWSVGAFVIATANEKGVDILNEGFVSYDEFFEKFVGETTYVFQKIVRPHSFFDGITKATSTVRLINLLGDDGLFSPFAVLKLPMKDNVADNFWRDENIICNLDVETGEILSIVSKDDLWLARHENLPGSERKFIGERLPHWDLVKEVNEKVALMHSNIRFNSTDIAITEDGPVVIEVNCGSAFELPQAASDQGFLTDEIREFFLSCGSTKV